MREQTQKRIYRVQHDGVLFDAYAADDVDAELSTLRAEQTRLREALTWKPIDTAPKDGTTVLAWDTIEHVLVFWHNGAWRDTDLDEDILQPTHWMAVQDITPDMHDSLAALSSTPTPRPGFDCVMCGHRHQDERFAFICIGCPCQSKPATPTPETTP